AVAAGALRHLVATVGILALYGCSEFCAYCLPRGAFFPWILPASPGRGLGRRTCDNRNRSAVRLCTQPVLEAERLQRPHGREPAHPCARVRGGVCLEPIAHSLDGCPRSHQYPDDAALGSAVPGGVCD